jgi:hypothetical protein
MNWNPITITTDIDAVRMPKLRVGFCDAAQALRA